MLVAELYPTLCALQPARLLCPWNSPDKITGVSSQSLLQGVFPTPGSNQSLLHCGQILYHLSHHIFIYEICVCGRYMNGCISSIHIQIDRERERDRDGGEQRQTEGKGLRRSHVSSSLKSFWPHGASLESVPFYLHVTYLQFSRSVMSDSL